MMIVVTYAEHLTVLANELLTRGSGHSLLLMCGQSASCIGWHFFDLLSNKKPAGHSMYDALPLMQLMYFEHEFGCRNAVLPDFGQNSVHFTLYGKSHADFSSLNKYSSEHCPGKPLPLLQAMYPLHDE